MRRLSFALFFLFVSPLYSQKLSEDVQNAAKIIEQDLADLRAAPSDLAIPSRWPLPHSLEAVEDILEDPSSGARKISAWTDKIAQKESPADLFLTAENILGGSAPNLQYPDENDPVETLMGAIREAYLHLTVSYRELSEKERYNALRVHDFPAPQDPKDSPRYPAFKRKAFKGLLRFNQKELMAAAEILMRTLEKEMPKLKSLKPRKRSTPYGNILIGGKGDDVYVSSDLANACLLIDLGGNNRYEGAVAGAKEGEIKIAIDFGENVTVVSTEPLSAGAGAFGIGLFYMQNSSGTKNISTPSYSQGFGLCGVGALFSRGKGIFRASRYVQGTGGFGAGIFSNVNGAESEYTADLYGQGVGFTRGIGIFRHSGSSATLKGGLTDPDPRESLGTTSLCQGVGYGPRAFAGGGVGLCVLRGNAISVESSYFAQGAGYWHALGAFQLEGNGNHLKARRYDQGSGVHSALGAFFLKGNDNSLVNWGVGPAFGWDRSIGWAFMFGDRNSAKTDWGAANAALNGSRSFLYFKGDDNFFELPGLGGGGYTRDIADYGAARIEGKNTVLKSPYFADEKNVSDSVYTSPWGKITFKDVTLSSITFLPKSDWTRLPQAPYTEREKTDFEQEIKSSKIVSKEDRVENLLAIASAFSTDKINPRQALAELILRPAEELPLLLRLMDPQDFDGFIQVRSVLSVLGTEQEKAFDLEFAAAKDPERSSLLLGQLQFMRAGYALPKLLKAVKSPEWRIQAQIIRSLGVMLSRDKGNEAGKMHMLENLKIYLSSSVPEPAQTEELTRELATVSFFQAGSILSLCWNKNNEEKMEFFSNVPNELSGNIESEKVKNLLEFVRRKRETALENITLEISASKKYEEEARSNLKTILSDPKIRKELVPSVLFALGHIGNVADAPLIEPFLHDSSATLKEAAAAALGRMNAGTQTLNAARNFTSPEQLNSLETALKDPNSNVRKMAVSAVSTVRYPLGKQHEELVARLKKEAGSEQDSSVKLQIRFLYGQ